MSQDTVATSNTLRKEIAMKDLPIIYPTDAGAEQREAEFLERVQAIVPLVRENSLEAESLRHLPEETVEAIRQTGMFRLHAPLAYGGLQLGLNAHAQAARLIAQGDLSTGWTASFLTLGSLRVSKRSKVLQDQIFGEQVDVMSCGTNQWRPGATIEQHGDKWIVNGRWGFASGVSNARYVEVTLPYKRNEQGQEQRIAAMLPTEKLEIVDVWHMSGMKATGSNDIIINNVELDPKFVTAYEMRNEANNPGTEMHPDFPFLRYSTHHFVFAIHVAYVLGAAERAVEYFRTDIAPKRQRPWGTGALIESPIVQRNFAEARYEVETAAVLFDHQIKLLEDHYARGVEPDWDTRAYLNSSSVGLIHQAARAVQIVARMSGGSMHRSSNELDRAQRDVEVLLNHSSGDWDFHAESSGRVQLGLGLGTRPDTFF